MLKTLRQKILFPKPPNLEEVSATLSNRQWQSANNIRDAINRERTRIIRGIEGRRGECNYSWKEPSLRALFLALFSIRSRLIYLLAQGKVEVRRKGYSNLEFKKPDPSES